MEALRSRYAGMKGIRSELESLEPCHPAHLLGRHGKMQKSLFSVRIPLPLKENLGTVHGDVIEGDHPFLIGLPTLERTIAKYDQEGMSLTIFMGEKKVTLELKKATPTPRHSSLSRT